MNLSFGDIFDGLPDEAVVLDDAGRIVASNAAWKLFASENGGDGATGYQGQNYFTVCCSAQGESSAEAALIPRGIREVLVGGSTFRCEYPCDSPTEKRWFELMASRIEDEGRPYALVLHRNISIRKTAELEAARAQLDSSILAALVASSNDAIFSYDLDGRITTWNRAAERLYGYSADEMVGQPLELLYPPGWPKRFEEYRDEILAGELTSFEAERVGKDGQRHRVWITASPIRGTDGGFVMVANIHRDVTEIRRAEEARELIAQEVIHRAKNMLAVVSAIHRQTARTASDLDEFSDRFGARLRGLATSTDLLVTGKWTTVSLDALVRSQIEPFLGANAGAVELKGPSVVLQPQAVQVLGMALHELATNSAKHGVLRDGRGRVGIGWRLEPGEDAPRLLFDWDETGPNTADPVRTGFGSTVLTGLSRSMLDAEASYEIAGGRVRWTLSVPAQHFRQPAVAGVVPGGRG